MLDQHSHVPADSEERRAGIIRLLSEAYCARIRKNETVEKEQASPFTDAKYDFLR